MKRRFPERKQLHAFTRRELIVIVAVVCVFFVLLVLSVIKGRAKAQRISCTVNLKSVAGSYLASTKPYEASSQQFRSNLAESNFVGLMRLYFAGTNQLNPRIFACPSDTRKPATNWATLSRTNVSYFISLAASEALPQAFLAGDRNIMTNGVRVQSGIVSLTPSSNVSWDGTIHRFQGNALMGDGSIQQLNWGNSRLYWTNQGISSVTLAVP